MERSEKLEKLKSLGKSERLEKLERLRVRVDGEVGELVLEQGKLARE